MTFLYYIIIAIIGFASGWYANDFLINRVYPWIYTRKCEEKFSLCLDCSLHNKCKRYGKHHDEMMKARYEYK